MNEAERLATLFERFPGIGPRQARRFVYFLLTSGNEYRGNLESAINSLTQNIHQCTICQRYYADGSDSVCSLCGNTSRNSSQLLIVEKDADLDQLEKSGGYSGRYFVLGGRVKLTDSSGTVPNQGKLLAHIKATSDLKEIIIAMPTTTEGEHTAEAIELTLKQASEAGGISITTLGRGLSTGAELEYADSATLKSALESRG